MTTTQTVHLSETDLASGAWGAVQTNPVAGVSSIVWTGVTNDAAYKTTKLVMRRVPSGRYMLGGNNVILLRRRFDGRHVHGCAGHAGLVVREQRRQKTTGRRETAERMGPV